MQRITGLILVLASLLTITACEAPVRKPEASRTDQTERVTTDNRSIDKLLLEAGRAQPPRSTELNLRAATLAMEGGDTGLADRILASVQDPYATNRMTLDYTFLAAELALSNGEPRSAVRLLDDRRFLALNLNTNEQVRTSRLRAEAYRQGRSYLASARELIYIDRLLPQAEMQANHEAIFSTLLSLDEATLRRQAEKSITSEIRGWLSLAAMTKRYQRDPLRQLNGLRDWQMVWGSHPAALVVPSSLQMLSRIVEERPRNIALILPLTGELGNIGQSIRDGYIAAHYQLTPDARLQVIDSSEGEILELVAQAHRNGAEMIIGPLDRDKVTRLSVSKLPVPVIALNRTLNGEINPDLYQFGLSPEDESMQVASQVIREGKQQGLVIAPDNDWGERNFNAFASEFTAGGGVIVDHAFFTEQRDYSDLVKALLNVDTSEERAGSLRRIIGERFEFSARRRKDIDFVFLLASASQARGINPTLAFFYADDIPVYATSHVNVATDSRIDAIDLNGIRFCDIPWKMSGDDDIQKLIEKTWPAASTQLAPFYALGVDVHRLYPRLQQLKEFPEERIFGSTGILTLNRDNVIVRTLMWGFFADGETKSVPMIFDGA